MIDIIDNGYVVNCNVVCVGVFINFFECNLRISNRYISKYIICNFSFKVKYFIVCIIVILLYFFLDRLLVYKVYLILKLYIKKC